VLVWTGFILLIGRRGGLCELSSFDRFQVSTGADRLSASLAGLCLMEEPLFIFFLL